MVKIFDVVMTWEEIAFYCYQLVMSEFLTSVMLNAFSAWVGSDYRAG